MLIQLKNIWEKNCHTLSSLATYGKLIYPLIESCVYYIYIYRVFIHLKKCGGKKCHTHCSLATCGKLNVRSKILISNIFGVLWFVKMCSLTLRLRWMVAHGRLAVRLSLSFIVSCRGWWWRMHEKLTCPNVHVF